VSSSVEATAAVPIRPARWPWLALAGFIVTATIALMLVAANDESIAEQVPFVIAFAMFGAVGALIVSRDRRNTIGLLLLGASALTAFSFLSGEVMTYAIDHGQTGSWLAVFGLLSNYGWLFGILPTVFLLPLLFPDGRLPSPRWRPFLWFVVGFLVFLAIDLTLGQPTLTGSTDAASIANPLYVDAVGQLPSLDPVMAALFPGIFIASVVSLILRFRRSDGAERLQIKWVVFGLLVAVVGILATSFTSQETVLTSIVSGGAFLMFPLSIGVAVLGFHLYDLDVVVRKALIYGAFALFATLIYLGLVVGVGVWLGRDNSFLTMVAAVVVALTFQPARARLTRFANRVVYGKRATPYEVLSEFSERVGGAYADEDVLPRMARILGEGIGADRADVWLAVDQELRDVAAWPGDVDRLAPIALPNGSVPAIPGVDRVYPVESAGELLGALAIRKPASDPVTPSDEKLIADLAGQAGLVLRNVRLNEELKVRFDELKAAQKRLVSAQDEGRRRLERNIHDGAQQQLVALAVKTRLARQLTERDPAKVTDILVQIEAETHQTLEDLRDLARGIYPPLLADKGLEAAIGSQAGRSTVPITLHAELDGRFDRDVEAAVYFSVLEALQNVAKYADAHAVDVRLTRRDGELIFEVVDDGRGFDPSAVGYGTGLQGIADRLGALDGSLLVTSAPGAGARLVGRLPVGDHVDGHDVPAAATAPVGQGSAAGGV
jgi:signal transduction histidine kinase